MAVSLKSRTLLLVSAMALAGLALQGCREEEQGRVLYYEKGTYLGKSDTPLSDDTLAEMQYRARMAY